MRALRWIATLVLVLGLAGCGAGKATVMPDVAGKRLDVAKSDIKRAGFDDDVEVLGGGILGVIEESNWTVCEQLPEAGAVVKDKPRLTVARLCDAGSAEPTTEASGEASGEPSATPSATASASADPTTVVPDVKDITVDKLLDRLNVGKSTVGDTYRLTGELFESHAWGTGASGEYSVMLKAKGGADDLMVFVNESDAADWHDGTKVEMVVENVKITLGGDTTDGWLRAKSVKQLA